MNHDPDTSKSRASDTAALPCEPLPWPIHPPPDPVDRELETLLNEPLASAWAQPGTAPTGLRGRLLQRLSASRAEAAAMVTTRLKYLTGAELAPGVMARTLYEAPQNRTARPGEPRRARLIDLQAGRTWQVTDVGTPLEWLVLRGSATIAGTALGPRDYHRLPASPQPVPVVASASGARLFLREPLPLPGAHESVLTVRDADAGWPEFAPGIRRRVLWQHDGQAALLYCAQAGAAVPQHSHGHDEECLMVQGELFLDDLLLQEGDYQLAPAGTGHRITQTDTGVVIYAHGDVELNFVT